MEQAILAMLDATDEMDRGEFFQLLSAVGFTPLDNNIQGSEWDRFLALLRCGSSRIGTSAGRLVTLKETPSGTNVLFRDTWTGRVYARDELCDEIDRGKYAGYKVRHHHGLRLPVSSPDKRRDNNLSHPVRSRLLS